MEELTQLHWIALLGGALIMGLSKGGIPGAGNLTVAIYALTLEDAFGPAGVALSVGLLLPVLISADLVSTLVYRKHVEWSHVRRLLPFFAVGVIVGWYLFAFFQGESRAQILKVSIGGILLGMTMIRFISELRFLKSKLEGRALPSYLGPPLGLLGGMATMIANAAGPIAQFYLLAMKLPKYAFIGTSAWLFLLINVSKFPLMWELGIIDRSTLGVAFWLFIPAALGALLAPLLVRHIHQDWFERLLWFFIVLAGLRMLF